MPSSPADARLTVLQQPCEAIVAAAGGALTWSFDDRFRACAATFPVAEMRAVRAMLQAGFTSCWDGESIGGAPPRTRELSAKIGGLRSGQLLFGANELGDPILFGAWWPWGNGTTISIRILFSARTLDEPQKDALLTDFAGWFGVRP